MQKLVLSISSCFLLALALVNLPIQKASADPSSASVRQPSTILSELPTSATTRSNVIVTEDGQTYVQTETTTSRNGEVVQIQRTTVSSQGSTSLYQARVFCTNNAGCQTFYLVCRDQGLCNYEQGYNWFYFFPLSPFNQR
ncbi:MAG: hypothetical protein HY986_16670 [Candidatus Melainabacteria bacterium]|nr:hypothetical protein [Candidatus Melainabacteria bacterium]